MSEEDPQADRPRRAHPQSEPEQTEPEQTEPEQTEPEQTEPEQTEPEQTEPEAEQTEPEAEQTESGPIKPEQTEPEAAPDEESQRPLYRDEPAALSPASAEEDSSRSTGDLSDETAILGRARERKRNQARRDPDDTTLLPRTAGGSRPRQRDTLNDDLDDDDFDDDIEGDPRARRRRLLLLIGAVAVVAILGLVAGYAIIKTTSQPIAAPGSTSSPGASDAGASSEASDPGSTALITDAMMLSATQAETLDSKRTWKVALTQRGSSSDAQHHPACLSSDSADGAPTPQQTVLQLLSSDGSDAPAALHQATAYGTPEEAAQAYAYAARSLGDCAMTGGWIYQGQLIGGVGDQSVGATIQVVDAGTREFRTVVLARTGRVVDVIDVAKPDRAVTAKRAATVAGVVVDTQCQVAGGACADEPEAQDGPPPLGGDQPGFLASGDLPPMGDALTRWAGTTPGEPDPDLLRGSGCESVDWAKVDAESRSHRTYLLSDSSSRFGLDEVVIATENEAAATKLAEKVRDDWKSCGTRQLTATVTDPTEISGPGAKSVTVKGWTAEVSQKADDGTAKYRVGIVTAGTKVAFVFLNPQDDLDLSTDQFDTVAVRAGQRASQVN